jgi:hypothetical protein
MAIAVSAEARRIFQALTLPEYLETWIVFPEQSADSSLTASQLENGYRLDQRAAGSVQTTITGSFLFRHHRKMRLRWRRTSSANSPQKIHPDSLVDFRLRGNFGSSILELRHSRFASHAEFFWHQTLWQNSLARLASLLRSAA